MPDLQTTRALRGAALRTARDHALLSARTLAERVNARTEGPAITDHAIYSYERGKVLLPPDVARRLAEILHVAPTELLAGDPDCLDQTSAPGTDAAPLSTWAAFEAGVMLATAEEMLDLARFAHDASGVLAQALSMAHGPEVDCHAFSANVGALLQRLKVAAVSSWAGRARRASSRYEDIADLVKLLDRLRKRLDEDWRELMKKSTDAQDPVNALAWCNRMGEDLAAVREELADVIGRCAAFASRTAEPFAGRGEALEPPASKRSWDDPVNPRDRGA